MEPITITIALIASLLVWRLSPLRALILFFAATLLYPQFLTLKIGTIDFNTGRIVILVLIAKLILQTRLLQELRWTLLDVLVLAAFFAQALALGVNATFLRVLEHEGGTFVSVIIPYIAIRAIVTTKNDFRGLVHGLVLIGTVLAFLGAYQSVTGHNPMGFMKSYDAWQPNEQRVLNRFGLYRADVSFGQYIGFGLFFSVLLPLSVVLHRRETNPFRTIAILMVLTMGVVSSMSSAPFFAFAIVTLCVAFYPFRKYSLILIAMMISSAMFLEFYSDRHFYEVMTRFALNQDTAIYRVGLINEAFGGGMDGHWLFGYGYVGIGLGSDNTHFHWEHQDLVNVYISRLARTGLLGAIPFVAMNAIFYRCLYRAWRASKSFEDRWMVWCLSTSLIGLNVALMTVGTVTHVNMILFVLIALAAGMPRLVEEEAEQNENQLSDENAMTPRHDGRLPGRSIQMYQDG